MIRYCMELPHGGMKHFPAGTYDGQMNTRTGRNELRLMSIVHSVWYMFKHLHMTQWRENELRLSRWMMPAEPEPIPPTRLLDDLIARLWPGSWWTRYITRSLIDG